MNTTTDQKVKSRGKGLWHEDEHKKTKTMLISRTGEIPKEKIQLDGQDFEQNSKFVHLGELVT